MYKLLSSCLLILLISCNKKRDVFDSEINNSSTISVYHYIQEGNFKKKQFIKQFIKINIAKYFDRNENDSVIISSYEIFFPLSDKKFDIKNKDKCTALYTYKKNNSIITDTIRNGIVKGVLVGNLWDINIKTNNFIYHGIIRSNNKKSKFYLSL
jgi:hypothetical protein